MTWRPIFLPPLSAVLCPIRDQFGYMETSLFPVINSKFRYNCSATTVPEHRRILVVPHPLWHGPPFLQSHPKDRTIKTPCTASKWDWRPIITRIPRGPAPYMQGKLYQYVLYFIMLTCNVFMLACKIYVNMRLISLNMKHNYVIMQHDQVTCSRKKYSTIIYKLYDSLT